MTNATVLFLIRQPESFQLWSLSSCWSLSAPNPQPLACCCPSMRRLSFTLRRKGGERQFIAVVLNKLNLADVFAVAAFLSQSVLRAVSCWVSKHFPDCKPRVWSAARRASAHSDPQLSTVFVIRELIIAVVSVRHVNIEMEASFTLIYWTESLYYFIRVQVNYLFNVRSYKTVLYTWLFSLQPQYQHRMHNWTQWSFDMFILLYPGKNQWKKTNITSWPASPPNNVMS